MAMETWDLWYPNAAAQGLSFARCRLESVDRVWVHSAPPELRLEVRDEAGKVVASGDQLRTTSEIRMPMTLLRRDGGRFVREDIWPKGSDAGDIVLLPGGEAGVLQSWWNAEDGSEWRWTIEFYNHR